MVYRLARPERKSKGWFLGYVVVRQGLVMLIIYALLWLLIPLDWDILAAAFLVTLVLVTCQNRVLIRRHERRFEMLGTQFVTLTEAGILVEGESTVMHCFVPWERIRRAWLHHDMLMVQQTNGLFHLLPTESLRREQAEEMLACVRAHAGKKQAPFIAPPAGLLSETPSRVMASPAQWREYVNFIMGAAMPGRMVAGYVGVFAIGLGCGLIWVWELYALLLPLLVIAVVLIVMVANPGLCARAMWKTPSPGYVHVSRDAVLVQADNGAWAVLPVGQIESAVQLRHGIVYRTRIHTFVLADSTLEPSPYLPLPRKVSRRPLLALLLVLVLPLVSLVSLSMLQPDPYEEAVERGEQLQMYVEELLPPQEYPGYITYCAYYADTQILSIDWEEDLEVYLHLSPEYEEGQSVDCPEEEA